MSNTFSILNRIDIPATDDARAWRMDRIRTFSILNRIDIPATPFLCYDSTAERSFQYPQPDRYPCNKNLSLAPVLPWLFFQYPQPDRYPCNLTCCFSDLHACSFLSVSSTGSISLQPNFRGSPA